MKKALAYLYTVVAAAAMAALAMPSHAQWIQGGGGLTDTSTGLVWSAQSVYGRTGSVCSWDSASTQATAYSATQNGVTYTGWRLPTIAELQHVIDNGTISQVLPIGPLDGVYYWT